LINPLDCTGKTILVTGASSGLGREISILLSQLGAKIVLIGRSETRLKETILLLSGKEHVIETRDLSDIESIPEWLKHLSSSIGCFNGLVHCAGVQITSPLRYTSVRQFEDLMRINVSAAFSLAKGFRQKGVCASPASIVYMSSVMAQVSTPGLTAYSASKGALSSLVKPLALELAKEGIRVNCLAPAVVKTEMMESYFQKMLPDQLSQLKQMHPLGLGVPRDVANAAAFLLADTGRWITGTTLVIDGGYTAH
jgi:NAD(P)-dependent dehydrogenase (short-subunit alcohol dehydrogenase family)